MKVAVVISFAMVAVAPFVGRWRANVWLKKHTQRERAQETVVSVPETA
jgi:hypothetical protein